MYNHNLVEKKWRKIWKDNKTYTFRNDDSKKKFYALDMFPYPSGAGLHVGHVKSYTPTDVYARYKRFCGYNVLHPIGWDAFGLPAEQYALKTKNHPGKFTDENINNFKIQMDQLGFSFDLNKEINTTDPKFYKWTQWIFLQLYKKGLAEIKDIDVNWCQELGTVLANEEVLTDKDGNKISERGGYPVTKKPMKQWVLKITEYADKLIDDLDEVNWTDGLKNIQKKWIGKSVGATVKFKTTYQNKIIDVFTSRLDTIYGVTFIGLSFDHEIVKEIAKTNPELQKLISNQNGLKDFLKVAVDAEKIGLLLPFEAIHPITNQKIKVFACNYVLSNYGNGAIMGVPAHDERDYDFAKKYQIDIVKVIECDTLPFDGDNKHINSPLVNGLNNQQAIDKLLVELKDVATKTTNYKLKDWLFSRQRYWGEPFPVLFGENGEILLDENLPLVLPHSTNIAPSGDGRSPLANLEEWVNVKIDNKLYKRETNTMPQWAGSSWYYLAYILKNDNDDYVALNSKEAYEMFKRWLPVDIYIGGQEHAVLHLLYSRFWHKFLYDINIVPTKEPFMKIINQGMILGSDGDKMSKSKGNVINPSEIVESHGADALRLYMMFMGPITASLPWDDNGIDGMYKWIQRVYRLFETKKIVDTNDNVELEKKYHQFVCKASKLMEEFEFNMVISEMMIFINECYKYETLYKDFLKNFIVILSCFAPFISEEINSLFLKNTNCVFDNAWPKYDEAKLKEDKVKIPIQILGKTREVLEFDIDLEEAKIVEIAKSNPKIQKWLENKNVVKIIYVKNKILNFIIK